MLNKLKFSTTSKSKFLRRSDFQKDLVVSFTNLDSNSKLKEIVFFEELSPYSEPVIHRERMITLKLDSHTFWRGDNTFLKKTYVGYETKGKRESLEIPHSQSSQEQCKKIFSFFQSKGLGSTEGLKTLCTSIEQDVETQLINDGHEILRSKSKI